MWRTERGPRYSKLVNRRLDVCHILQPRLNESPTFIFHSFVVGANQLNQIDVKGPGIWYPLVKRGSDILRGRKTSEHCRLLSMGLEGLPSLEERLQAGKNTRPSIGAGSVRRVIVGPLVMRHCYFGGFGLGQQFDRCA